MLDERALSAALATLRRAYMALSEVRDLTQELTQAVERQDQVSVQLFLRLRLEQLNQLQEYRDLLAKQCRDLPKEAGETLRGILEARECPIPDGQTLFQLAKQYRQLLKRTIQADMVLNRRMGGKNSYYAGKR